MKKRIFKVASTTDPEKLAKALYTNLYHDDDVQRYDAVRLVCIGQNCVYKAVQAVCVLNFICKNIGYENVCDMSYSTTLARDKAGDEVSMACVVIDIYTG